MRSKFLSGVIKDSARVSSALGIMLLAAVGVVSAVWLTIDDKNTSNVEVVEAKQADVQLVNVPSASSWLEEVGYEPMIETEVKDSIDFTNQLVVFDPRDYQDPVELLDCHVTCYCDCKKCCGKYAGLYTTSTGAETIEGITIAVDPDTIPYGSIIELDGHFYIAEDCGGGLDGVEVDVYIKDETPRHTYCKQFMENLGSDHVPITVWFPKSNNK